MVFAYKPFGTVRNGPQFADYATGSKEGRTDLGWKPGNLAGKPTGLQVLRGRSSVELASTISNEYGTKLLFKNT